MASNDRRMSPSRHRRREQQRRQSSRQHSFRRSALAVLLALISAALLASAFTVPQAGMRYRQRTALRQVPESDVTVEDVRTMSVRDLKTVLTRLGVRTTDVFEKEQLVQRLMEAKRRKDDLSLKSASAADAGYNNAPTSAGNDAISVPMTFTALDDDKRIPSSNMIGGVQIKSDGQVFATLGINVIDDVGNKRPMALLLDTACSGLVLRPSAVRKFDLRSYETPVTMTGAGGMVGTTGMSQLDRFELAGGEDSRALFGPLPAAVQEIGTLPSALDGIIGLSFLSQFSCVDFDFRNGRLNFYRDGAKPSPAKDGNSTVVSECEMEMLPLGVYAANVWLGNRGPVKMLVDTGAACTLLNWKGVRDLGISKDRQDSFLQRIPTPMGTMGADNIAMELTHRLFVSSTLSLERPGSNEDKPGLALKGEKKRLSIDIGNIAILDQLNDVGVGGILGSDALLRSSSVRIFFQGPRKVMQILE